MTRGGYSEVRELEGNNLSFRQLSDYFKNLANDKGAVYAFEVLKRAHIPPHTDIHLLGHDVGDILYDQEGIDGIRHCTDDFRNACSHQIVINALVENGPSAFSDIAAACRSVKGGKNSYSMCFHGLGHGVLAYNGYEFDRAITMCGQTGSEGGTEELECMGGVSMEMVAGVHDPEVWKGQAKKYLDPKDPLAPCNTSAVPQRGKRMCYVYVTPRLFEAAGERMNGIPSESAMEKAMAFCRVLSGSDRQACYGGFGKDFAPMSNGRDIRAMGAATDAGLERAFRWCSLAKVKDGIESCVVDAMKSFYWSGDVSYAVPIRFCEIADARGFGRRCFESFLGSVGYNFEDKGYRAKVCGAMPEGYKEMCETRLL